MDVDEFFNTLMDRLETTLKPFKHEFILKDVFEGQLSNELIGKGSGCTHNSEVVESFLAISLPIKNKKCTLGECLDSFVQGEMLDGDNSYFCEKCN
jgi:ubiquitin carboxyl-terminal hydrolase 9/24